MRINNTLPTNKKLLRIRKRKKKEEKKDEGKKKYIYKKHAKEYLKVYQYMRTADSFVADNRTTSYITIKKTNKYFIIYIVSKYTIKLCTTVFSRAIKYIQGKNNRKQIKQQ